MPCLTMKGGLAEAAIRGLSVAVIERNQMTMYRRSFQVVGLKSQMKLTVYDCGTQFKQSEFKDEQLN